MQIAVKGRTNEQYIQRLLALRYRLQREEVKSLFSEQEYQKLMEGLYQTIRLLQNNPAYIKESEGYISQQRVFLVPCAGRLWVGLSRGHICHAYIGTPQAGLLREGLEDVGWMTMDEARLYFEKKVDATGSDDPTVIRVSGDISYPDAKWGTHTTCPECRALRGTEKELAAVQRWQRRRRRATLRRKKRGQSKRE